MFILAELFFTSYSDYNQIQHDDCQFFVTGLGSTSQVTDLIILTKGKHEITVCENDRQGSPVFCQATHHHSVIIFYLLENSFRQPITIQ